MYMVYIVLDKAYGKSAKECIMGSVSKKKCAFGTRIWIVQNMYVGAWTTVRSICGDVRKFTINVVVH